MVTAVAFSVEGSVCAAGTFSGKVHFFSDHLCVPATLLLGQEFDADRASLASNCHRKPQSQLKVRSTRGKNSKGKKITVRCSSSHFQMEWQTHG